MSLEKFDRSQAYTRHEKAHLNGGVHLKDDESCTVKKRDVFFDVLKSIGAKLKEGKMLDILKISRPALLSAPKTYLECIASDFYYTKFLDKAAATDDPVQRLKYVVAFVIASLHYNTTELGNNGPLNPVLGETYSAEKNDGTAIYCEQISHHPPVSAYLLTHPTGAYKLHGTGEVMAKMTSLNSINGQKVGDTIIEFKNGAKVVIGNPEMKIEGLVLGERIINYAKSFVITDEKYRLQAEITFNYEEVGTMAKLASSFKGLFGSSKTEKPLNDTFTISLYQVTKKANNEIDRAEICSGSGSWLSHIEIEGEVYWKVTDPRDDRWKEVSSLKLVSDSRNRMDSKFIRVKNFEQAQKEKEDMENLQRADAKLRKTGKGK